MRLLQRLRQHLDVLQPMEAAVEADALVRPRGEHDLDGLAEALVALGRRHLEGIELHALEATSRTPVDAPTREHASSAISSAMRSGCWKAASVTAVPMRSRRVRAATCVAIRCADGQTL